MQVLLTKLLDTHLNSQNAIRVPGQRFLFIDGLRAFAAIAMVLYHFYEAISQTATGSWAWQWVETLFSYGYLE
jgi:peptidoglycan/LPS O-acetylase OafA/YrhL